MNKDGKNHELTFWKGFVKTSRFSNNWASVLPNPECQPETRQLIETYLQENPKAKVLDLGSGVVSILRGIVPDDQLTAVDPLADDYRRIFDYSSHGITPPVTAPGEKLPQKTSSFNIVHISNALDHADNPGQVLSELRRVCKKGGLVIVSGFVREGEFEKYQGLHQWNIEAHKTSGYYLLSVTDKDDRMNAVIRIESDKSDLMKVYADKVLETGRRYFIFAFENDG